MRRSLSAAFSARHELTAEGPDPAVEFGSLTVTDHPIGAVLSIGLFLIV